MTLCLRSSLLTAAGFRHGFSLRTGGVSEPPFQALNLARNLGDAAEAVRENHQRLAMQVGYVWDRLYEVSQVHGAAVEAVDTAIAPGNFRAREADALWSQARDTAVGVRVADCVPILVAHPKTGLVCAIHAGWRGVVAGVIARAVAALTEQAGVGPGDLLAAVGPHIGPDAFEVGHEVAEALLASVPDVPGLVLPRAPRPHVDLGRAVLAQLTRAGLPSANVERVPGCTFSEPQQFFSFRRDGQASGRHLAVIVAGC